MLIYIQGKLQATRGATVITILTSKKKNTFTIRETGISRHNGGPNEGPPLNPSVR